MEMKTEMAYLTSSMNIPYYNFSNTYNLEKLENLGSIKGFEDVISEILSAFPEKHPYLDTYMGSIIDEMKRFAEKNSARATELRNKGNKLYAKSKSVKDFVKVFRAYNESITLAPNNSQEMALVYGNRAMVLFRLKYYNECLADINRALCLDYPDKSVGKLLFKKVRCMKILNHPDLLITYNDCLKWIDKHSTNIQEMRREIKKAYEEEVTHPCLNPVNTQLRDDLLDHMKKLCPNLDKVQIKRNKKGKLALVATRDIQVNEVIGIQKVYTQILHTENSYLACCQCVIMCLNPIPCDGCSVETYCSESCKAEAWSKHHQYVCPVMYIIKTSMPNYLLPIKICMVAMKQLGGILPLMKEVYKMSKISDIKQEHHIVDGVYASNSYRNVYYMINKASVTEMGYGEPVMNVCSFVSNLATRTTFFGHQYKGELITLMQERPLKFFAALILRHFVMLQNLTRNEWTLQEEIIMSSTSVCPLFHILEHSCNPNSVKVSLKDHQILVAIDKIKKGKEINISKGKRMLTSNADTECECQVCIQQNPQKMTSFSEIKEEALFHMLFLNEQMTMTISDYEQRRPKTHSEFVKRTADFYEKFYQPFSAATTILHKNIIHHKNHLMNLYFQIHSDINSFMCDQLE